MIKRKTKIVCTIGPSTRGIENLVKLIEAGMDAARLNFSHGTHEQHLESIRDIREASRITGKHVAILQDLQGPKIRTCKVLNGRVFLEDGADFIITIDELEFGNEKKVSTTYKNIIKEVKKGNTILLDDGYIILQVTGIESNNIITEVVKGGYLKDNKGIITPGVSSSAPSLSEKDLEDLKFGLSAGVDIVCLSFVRSERDVMELRTIMKLFGRIVPIVAKIERYEGYEDIEDIVHESDGIMVARGDLGLEMPAEQVPVLQKEIISKCNQYGIPVITATQMLESMITNPRPTRAEASDVANAVLDGTDCVMLSGETSTGKYPLEAVTFMDKIICSVENRYQEKFSRLNEPYVGKYNIGDALGKAACLLAGQIDAKALVTITGSGYTAQNISKYRPLQPVIAFTANNSTLMKLAIVRGVIPVPMPEGNEKDKFTKIMEEIKLLGVANEGDNIVIATGPSPLEILPSNMVKIAVI
jgi:pyruvate kinase